MFFTLSLSLINSKSSPVTTNVGLLEKSIQLASCGPKELLPMNPGLPADLFTACLTTPIKTALLWFCRHKVGHVSLVSSVTPDMIDKCVCVHEGVCA